jgi:transposase
MAHRRKFIPEFKAEVGLEWLSGAKSSTELCREHQMASSVLADWKAIFVERAASRFDHSESCNSQETTRMAE